MIVYLATYPRSGNDLLQAIIRRNLHRMTSQVSGKTGTAESFQAALGEPGWRVEAAPGELPGHPAGLLWNDGTAVYRFEDEPWRRMLLPGPISQLDEPVRRALAAEDGLFVFKLHSLPFDAYLDGEHVIQMVRHPGATLWSLFRYLIDSRLPRASMKLFSRPPLTLGQAIAGDVQFGNWSDYHLAWTEAAGRLGPRFLRLKYEDAVAKPEQAIAAIADFVSLPVLSAEPERFESYRQRWPGMDLRGSSEGYERFFTRGQLEDLWRRHEAVAEGFGYGAPDLEAGQDESQVALLEAIIEAAWRRGARVEYETWELTHQLRRARLASEAEG